MTERENIRKELAEIAPELSQYQGVKDGFQAPSGYFSNLTNRVLVAVDKENVGQSDRSLSDITSLIQKWLIFSLQPRYALAMASIFVLVIAGWLFLRPAHHGEDALASITAEEAYKYALEHLDEIDPDLVTDLEIPSEAQLFGVDPLNQSDLDQYLEEFSKEIDDEALEDLL